MLQIGKPNSRIQDWCQEHSGKNLFYFKAVTADATVKLAKTGAASTIKLESSRDGITWDADYDCYSETAIPKGTKLYLRAGSAGNQRFGQSSGAFNSFILSGGKVRCRGNIMYLLNQVPKAEFDTGYQKQTAVFAGLFINQTNLLTAPDLTSTNMAMHCYQKMFQGCTSLSYMNVSFSDWTNIANTFSWLTDVSESGTFVCPAVLPDERDWTWSCSHIPASWNLVRK